MLATGLYKGIGEINAVHFPATGFGETDFSPLGAPMQGIMALARKHKVPAPLHVEITRMAELSALTQQWPDVTVLWAHGGYTPAVSGAADAAAASELAHELSARTWPRHPRSPDYTILAHGRRCGRNGWR